MLLLKAAANSLQQCYHCLSTGLDAPPITLLDTEAINFAKALISLEKVVQSNCLGKDRQVILQI
eukprot:4503028-Amphidinium_carterae.1